MTLQRIDERLSFLRDLVEGDVRRRELERGVRIGGDTGDVTRLVAEKIRTGDLPQEMHALMPWAIDREKVFDQKAAALYRSIRSKSDVIGRGHKSFIRDCYQAVVNAVKALPNPLPGTEGEYPHPPVRIVSVSPAPKWELPWRNFASPTEFTVTIMLHSQGRAFPAWQNIAANNRIMAWLGKAVERLNTEPNPPVGGKWRVRSFDHGHESEELVGNARTEGRATFERSPMDGAALQRVLLAAGKRK